MSLSGLWLTFPAAIGAAPLVKIRALSQDKLPANKAKRRQRSEGAAALAPPQRLECRAELASLPRSPRELWEGKEEGSGKAGCSL